jgi:hypothetical protein
MRSSLSLLFPLGSYAVLSALSIPSMGCVSPTEDRPDAEASATAATAVVVVERTSGPGDTVRGDAVIARFVRVRQGAVDDQALRLAGAAWDLPSVSPALGTCSATAREVLPALQTRNVDLLDLGVLTVDSAANRSTVLLPRSLPDPTGVVSGVFYSARSGDAFAPAGRIQIHTPGGPDMAEGFRVDVPAPRDIADARVSATQAGLELGWDPDGGPGDGRKSVYIDVVGPSSVLVTRCSTLDFGQFLIPAAALGSVAEGAVSIHRTHRESFRTKGIDPGEVRFDIARVVTFHRF